MGKYIYKRVDRGPWQVARSCSGLESMCKNARLGSVERGTFGSPIEAVEQVLEYVQVLQVLCTYVHKATHKKYLHINIYVQQHVDRVHPHYI